MDPSLPGRRRWARRVAVVVAATVLLTAAFVGVLALASGAAAGVADRLALYFLCGGGAFLVSTYALSNRGLDGTTVLLATVGVSVLTLLLALLAGEGIVYAAERPGAAFDLRLLGYFAAAGLVVIGLTFWTVRYWREFLPAGEA